MSAMTVSKQSDKDTDKLLKQDHVRRALKMVQGGDSEGVAIMEATLIELALMALHAEKDEMRRAGRRAVVNENKRVEKLYRAVAKSAFQSGDFDTAQRILKARTIHVSEYTRQDGTVVPEHTRQWPEGGSEEDQKVRDDIVRELNEMREYQRSQEPRYGLDRLDGLAEQAVNAANNETYQGAMKSYLEGSTDGIGRGIVAVADFLGQRDNKFSFAAKAISEFGPLTGSRLAYNYFRYGGYDVPMKQKNGKVVTELGDELPQPGSVTRTRDAVVDILKSRLPTEGADEQEAKPPSEGFVIDKDGNVLAHAVGRGHDHFIPFNAKHLRKIRQNDGVEYVRRRMYGGPTVEDLHAAMAMGADRVTVISNGGEYSFGLKSRAHGLKMEHGQILMRYQDILDDNRNRNFQAYDEALESMESEFPLHFSKIGAEKGKWAFKNDRIRPEHPFRTQLREMFQALSGDDSGDSRSGTVPDLSRSEITRLLPNIRQEETLEQYTNRMLNANVDRNTMLNRLNNYYMKRYGTKAREQKWIQRRFNLGEFKNQGQQQQQGQQQARTRVPSDQGVTVRQADKAELAARNAQSRQNQPSARIAMPPEARRRFEDIGIDPKGYNSGDAQHAKELAHAVNQLTDQQWFEKLEDPDFLNDLQGTFSNITGT